MNVYAFHIDIADYGHYYTGLVDLWKENWKKHGFNPVIFDYTEINLHPLVKECYEKISAYPSSNIKEYQEGNLMRWLGYAICLERYGEGITVDTDVFNFGLTPDMLQFDKSKLTTLSDGRKSPPMSVYANTETVNTLLEILMNYKGEGIVQHNHQQISDMIIFYESFHLFQVTDFESLFDMPEWKRFPLVHFANESINRWNGSQPDNKADFIKQFLPVQQ